MTLAEEIEKINRISETDFKEVIPVLFNSVRITPDTSVESIKHHHTTINQFITLLTELLADHIPDSTQKLSIVKLLDKLNLQKELIEMKIQGVSIEDIKVAAERLGKKSQSAFGD